MKPELQPDNLLIAYARGIFPMADSRDGRIRWFSPDPRAIIELNEFHVPKTLRQLLRQRRFEVRVNQNFQVVMRHCADRPDETWISADMIEAYTRLHELGFAHSIECYADGELAGGLYGLAIGGAFFGESMFHHVRDASKVALAALVERLIHRRFVLLDVQFLTEHLARFGAKEIPRPQYLGRLSVAIAMQRAFVRNQSPNGR